MLTHPARLLQSRPLFRTHIAHLTTFPSTMSPRRIIEFSPPSHPGMTGLEKDAFRKSIPVLAAKVEQTKTGYLLGAKALKNTVINLPRIRPVERTDDETQRLVILQVSDKADLTPEALEYLEAQSAELVDYTLELDYDYWTAEDIIHSILPEELRAQAPSGFACVGHIAHLNLPDAYLPYKHLIGKVIMEKNINVKTVVNKVDTIDDHDNKFRVFKIEVLAGEPNFVVNHSESHCHFTFDFSQVYWNSRLHTEHARLIDLFKPEDLVADVFAGVGPFAIPAAKKGCAILANDLNPMSYRYLVQNANDNKVSTLVRTSCLDGREFIRSAFNQAFDAPFPPLPLPKMKVRSQTDKQKLLDARKQHATAPVRRRIGHFSMNLPASAIEFLDAFQGVLSEPNAGGRDLGQIYEAETLPLIHCYCFTRELEPDKAEADIRERVERVIGHPLGADTSLHKVRSVAPNKDMYCISFRLPYAVAFA